MKTPNEILVVDIESTCWDASENSKESRISEIIEIGVTVYNFKDDAFIKNDSIYVKPQVSTISEFCTNLTGITQELLDNKGVSFTEALDILKKKYLSKKRYWASYGNYDRKMFEKQCRRLCLEYPFHDTHFNVKSMFRLLMGLNEEVGMPDALDRLNLPLTGRHHNGGDDSYNITCILRELLQYFKM